MQKWGIQLIRERVTDFLKLIFALLQLFIKGFKLLIIRGAVLQCLFCFLHLSSQPLETSPGRRHKIHRNEYGEADKKRCNKDLPIHYRKKSGIKVNVPVNATPFSSVVPTLITTLCTEGLARNRKSCSSNTLKSSATPETVAV